MKQFIIKVIFLVLFAKNNTDAQTFPVKKSIKLSSIDTVLPFSEGLAVFLHKNGKWGAINNKNTIVVKPKYEFLSHFHEGLAAFWVNLDYIGYLNTKGEEVHRRIGIYSSSGDFEGGLGEVSLLKIGQQYEKNEYDFQYNPFDSRRNFINHSFKLLIPYKYDSIAQYRVGKVRLVSKWAGKIDAYRSIPIYLARLLQLGHDEPDHYPKQLREVFCIV